LPGELRSGSEALVSRINLHHGVLKACRKRGVSGSLRAIILFITAIFKKINLYNCFQTTPYKFPKIYL
jgi:hypothetical protein